MKVNDEVVKLRDFNKNLKKQGEGSKEPYFNFKIPFSKKYVRKCEDFQR